MKNNLIKGKSTRTKIFTVITAALIVCLLAVNFGLTYLGTKSTVFLDLTREGFYSLTDKMDKTMESILEAKEEDGSYRLKNPVKITFCDDVDNLVASRNMRPLYFMALDIKNKFDNFDIQVENVRVNPAAVAMYKTTSLDTITTTDVIISYGAKYRVIDGNLWEGENYFSYNGEYVLASVIASLTAVSQPAVYFTVGHGETVYNPAPEAEGSEGNLALAAFADLLYDCGFTIKLLDLSKVTAVPDDCTLLIINAPTGDFKSNPDDYDRFDYVSDIEKIDRFLVRGSGAVILNKDYRVSLPELEAFAEEWGLGFGNAQVRDPESAIGEKNPIYPELYGSDIAATYDTGEYSLGSAYYGKYAALASAPKMVFADTGYMYCSFFDGEVMSEPGGFNVQKTYASFIGTTDTAAAYLEAGSDVKVAKEGKKSLAAMTVRVNLDSYASEKEYSYFFATNTDDFFKNELLSNRSYSNRDILMALIQNISRTETHASVELGGGSLNSTSFGGKQTVSTTLSETAENYYAGDGTKLGTLKAFGEADRGVFVSIAIAIPAAVLVLGVIFYIRRRFL